MEAVDSDHYTTDLAELLEELKGVSMPKRTVNYVTSNEHKAEELAIIERECTLSDGTPIRDLFDFQIRRLPILETLEIDIRVMVQRGNNCLLSD